MTQSLSEIKQALIQMKDDAMYDLAQDWNEDKERMRIQIQMLSNAIASIEYIRSEPGSQIFKSVVAY